MSLETQLILIDAFFAYGFVIFSTLFIEILSCMIVLFFFGSAYVRRNAY